jgi:hypothetical protein
MRLRNLVCVLALALSPAVASAAPAAAPQPVEVMVVGDYHMGNPGRDLHNVVVPDVLTPDVQAQIVRATDALARFRPTKVAAEWPADIASERYAKYLAGTLAPSRNEVVQLGFRLARTAGLKAFYGIDVDGDFPYDAVDAYAKAHGQGAVLEHANAVIQTLVETQGKMIAEKGVSATLRYLNDPALLAHANDFYRDTLRIGGGKDQPGADLLTAWYRRNFLICANLVQLSRPGDRIVVFYGSGHAFLLRQCVSEMPGFKLIEPNAYLPR